MNRIILSLIAFLTLTTSVVAQNDNSSRRERQTRINMTEVYERQATRLIKDMKLEKDKQDGFTAMYLDYQAARFNAVNPNGGDQEGTELSTDLKELTDENADELVQKNFARQEKQLEVDKEYYKKFLEYLTPSQAARIFLQTNGGSAAMNAARQMGNFGGGNFGGGMGGRGGGGGFGGGGGGF